MLRAVSLATLLAVFAATTLGAPVDEPISFSTTVSTPLATIHNRSVLASVCKDMTPNHADNMAQATPPPYGLSIRQRSAKPGDTVQVKIYGKNEQFRGVYIQGRHGDTPVGEFFLPGPEPIPVELSDCPPGVRNAASYISRQPIGELTLNYVVPDVPSIIFRATFVKTFSYFWTNVVSEELLVSKTKA